MTIIAPAPVTARTLATLSTTTSEPVWKYTQSILSCGSPLAYPSVMASPPTLSYVTSNNNGIASTPSFANQVFVSLTDARINVYQKSSWPTYFVCQSIQYYQSPTTGGSTVSAAVIAVRHEGQNISFQGRAGDYWQFIVDGQLVQSGVYSIPSAGGYATTSISLAFPTRKAREIIAIGQTNGFSGIIVQSTDTLSALDISRAPSISWMTDSYGSAAAGTGDFPNLILTRASMRLGARGFLASVTGGSGYITNGTGTLFSNAARVSGVTLGSPDLIMTMGGINDGTTGLQTACASYFASLRSACPKSIIGAGGNWNPNGTSLTIAQTKSAAIYAALQTIAGPWIWVDNIAGTWANSSGASGSIGTAPWQTGDGRYVTATAAIAAATSATLSAAWAGSTGTYNLLFSDGTTKTGVTLTNGSTAVSWTGAVTATAQIGVYSSAPGNGVFNVGPDGTHPGQAGAEYLGDLLAAGIAAAVLAL